MGKNGGLEVEGLAWRYSGLVCKRVKTMISMWLRKSQGEGSVCGNWNGFFWFGLVFNLLRFDGISDKLIASFLQLNLDH